jgi:hypothetical protein
MRLARIVVASAVAALGAGSAYAQGAPDFSKVEIKANRVTDKFYTLDGQGGTIGVLFGPDGVFMVDTQFAPLSDKIAAADQTAHAAAHQVRRQHARAWRPHRRRRELRKDGRDDHFARGAALPPRASAPAANGSPGVPTAAVGLPKQTYRETADACT